MPSTTSPKKRKVTVSVLETTAQRIEKRIAPKKLATHLSEEVETRHGQAPKAEPDACRHPINRRIGDYCPQCGKENVR